MQILFLTITWIKFKHVSLPLPCFHGDRDRHCHKCGLLSFEWVLPAKCNEISGWFQLIISVEDAILKILISMLWLLLDSTFRLHEFIIKIPSYSHIAHSVLTTELLTTKGGKQCQLPLRYYALTYHNALTLWFF